MADKEKTNELSLEELVRENFSKKVADKFLDEFDELPSVITCLADSNGSSGEFYDYVKECVKTNNIPSGIDYCKRYIKDGKYTIEGYSFDTYDELVNSGDLFFLEQV